jgi:hypothetical protein
MFQAWGRNHLVVHTKMFNDFPLSKALYQNSVISMYLAVKRNMRLNDKGH